MSRCFAVRIRFSSLTAIVAATTTAFATLAATPATAKTSPVDRDTDITVSIAAPDVVVVGESFRAVVSVANVGRNTARALSCSVATPRLDAVTLFRVGVTTRPIVEPVEGSESRSFKVASLRAGQMVSIPLTGTTMSRSSLPGFTLSAVCHPTPVDANQANNASQAKVAFLEG